MKQRIFSWLAFALAVVAAVLPLRAQNFDPQDGGAVIAGLKIHVAPMGDPYAATSQNPGGAFLDTGNLRAAKNGDYIRQLKDLAGGTVHFGIAAADSQPPLIVGKRNGPCFRIVPPNRFSDAFDYPGASQRIRVSDIDATTSSYDTWVGSGVLNAITAPSGKTAKCIGLDSGWMYILNASGTFTVGEQLTWTDNNSVTKHCNYRGPTESLQYLDAPATSLSAAGGASLYIAMRAKPNVLGSRSFWFSFNNNAFTLGCWDGGSGGAPKLTSFIGGTPVSSTTLCPSQSPQIYSVRADGTNIKLGMGDLSETLGGVGAVTTGAQVPRIGAYAPGGAFHWPGCGDYYYVLEFNVKLSDADHARVLAYLRKVTNIQEPIGLLTIPGYSITGGENATEDAFWANMEQLEALGFEIRVNAIPGIAQAAIKTNILATTGSQAWTAPYVSQSNYRYKVALAPGLVNNYRATPGGVAAGITALQATIVALQGQGHTMIFPTTDMDAFTIGDASFTAQFRADVAAGNALIRTMGYTVVDWGAVNRLGRSGAAQCQEYVFQGYIHQNSTGHQLMGKEAERVMYPVLSNMVSGSGKQPLRNRNQRKGHRRRRRNQTGVLV